MNLAFLGIALFSLLLLALRFLVLPKIEDYRPEIEAQLSAAVGHPVDIKTLRAGWDGWNPRLGLAELTVRGKSGEALLTLPEVSATLSWQSLLRFELHLKALVLERPSLRIRRTAEGRFSVGGLELDPETSEADPGVADWLLRQRRVEIHEALIIWQDDLRRAPQLLLDRVNFRLENRFGEHSFGLTGTPPPEVAGPLDLRGSFEGDSLASWQKMTGRAYLRLDYADVATWREWLPLPAEFARGEGALRLWFGFARGLPHELTADLELRDVAGRFDAKLPELQLKRVAGRLAWRAGEREQEIIARQLVIESKAASTPEPLDFVLKLRRQGEAWTGGQLRLNTLDLAAMGILANHLPLPDALRKALAARAPRGLLREGELAWTGSFDAPELAKIKVDFVGLGVRSSESQPGFINFSGRVEGDAKQGTLRLASRGGAIQLPKVFQNAIPFDKLDGRILWRQAPEGLVVQIAEAEFSSAHATGSASGQWRGAAQGAGDIDLKAKLTRADPRAVHAYLPLVVGDAARQYLKRSLTGGLARDATLELRGPLDQFPFDDASKGIFEIRVRAEDASMDYAPGWPPLEQVRADLLFRGSRMEITSNQAQTLGVKLSKVLVTIPDLGADAPVLQVQGEANGASADFLRFVAISPVLGMIDRFTEGIKAEGQGKLDLKLAIPLAQPEDTKVVGAFSIADNEIRVGADMPPLARATGTIRFTERDVRAEGINAQMLGGPVQGLVSSAEGTVRISARGQADASELRRNFSSPLLRAVSGRTDWQAEVSVRGGKAQWMVDSSLRGVQLDLPPPLAKSPEQPLPLHLEQRGLERDQSLFALSLGQRLEFQTLSNRDPKTGRFLFERGFLALGGAKVDLSQPGLWVRGEVAQIDLDRWLDFRPRPDAPIAPDDATWPSSADLAGLDLQLGRLKVMDRHFEDLHLAAAARSGRVNVNLTAPQLAGTLAWSPATPSLPNGQLTGRFQRLSLPTAENVASPGAAPAEASEAVGEWPALDLMAENFNSKGKNLGKLELKAHPEGQGWKLERLKLVAAEGTLEASGRWSVTGVRRETQADLQLDIREAGSYLARFGMPDAVKGAPTKLAGRLSWVGPPNDLDYGSLSGKLKLEVGKGQFTKIEPGLGKLLGILSLQALPRRLTLDFGDLFASGFAFDSIAGDIAIQQGVLSTEKLLIDGPSAKVEIRGQADIAKENQDLQVRVFPSLGTSAAMTAILAGNPVAGGVTLLVSQLLKDPLGRLFSYQYHVTGAWNDPQVANVAANITGSDPNAPGVSQ